LCSFQKGAEMVTEYDKKFARLIVEGKKPLVDCYIEAHFDNSTPARTVANYPRDYLTSRATRAAKANKIKALVEELGREVKTELIKDIAWDRKRAATLLINDINRLDQFFAQAKDVSTATKLSQCIRNDIVELNKVYGIYNTPAEQPTKTQYIYLDSCENAPPDVDSPEDLDPYEYDEAQRKLWQERFTRHMDEFYIDRRKHFANYYRMGAKNKLDE